MLAVQSWLKITHCTNLHYKKTINWRLNSVSLTMRKAGFRGNACRAVQKPQTA